MVLVVVLGAGRIDSCEERRASINVLARGSGGGSAIVIFSGNFGAGENVNGCSAPGDFFDAQAVAVIGVSARTAAIGGAGGAAFTIIDESIDAIVGHVAGGVVGIRRTRDTIVRGVKYNVVHRRTAEGLVLIRAIPVPIV